MSAGMLIPNPTFLTSFLKQKAQGLYEVKCILSGRPPNIGGIS